MKEFFIKTAILLLIYNLGIAQTNRIVYGPLEGDNAGIKMVHSGDAIEVEMWVRTDPGNPTPIVAISHALLSEDAIIASREGAEVDPYYDMPNWEQIFLDGPYVHNPGDDFPIPVGHTCEILVSLYSLLGDPPGDPLDTQGEWDYYGAFLMTCDADIPPDNTYYPFSMGWYPHSGQGTSWSFVNPPGGQIEPEQDYCGLYVPPQFNKIVYGPLAGDEAGVLLRHPGDQINVEMWVRTDPGNPTPIVAVSHALLTEDAIIASREGAVVDPYYDMPNWEQIFLDGPYVHDPGDEYSIPVGHTCEILVGIYSIFGDPPGDPLDTQGEWDYYGAFQMTCDAEIPPGNMYYPFSMGWYPHSGQGTSWSFENPPGGQIEPDQDYCGLYLAPHTNRIVYGPLVGDEAGILLGNPGNQIDVEMWVRTDPDNPAPIVGVSHALMTEDAIIALRQGALIDPDYDMPNWEQIFIDGPYVHDPGDDFPIPVGHTCEIVVGIYSMFNEPLGDPLDTQGEWDYYGTFRMTCDEDIEIGQTYEPFSMGWYPHSGQGTDWSYENPPGGAVVPDQQYCSLHITYSTCEYFRGDCNHNGIPYELDDAITMIGMYRGIIEPSYTCPCPPHGDDFVPQADVNGNCVPFELNDAIVMINVYRGNAEPSGCPDCPGSLW